ncbi:hypothetical protein G9A89_004963 [Geosiphon pyriformis]|nr:hypothetical protein G9A89_004963 [Geosiphon pyriformis]
MKVAIADTPIPRRNHASILINNKIYVYGGRLTKTPYVDDKSVDTNELWTLDISKPFTTASPSWVQEPSENAPIASYETASLGGVNNDLLVIYNGETSLNPPPPDALSFFNTTSNVWNTPKLNATTTASTTRRLDHTAVTNFNDSSIWILGGLKFNPNNSSDKIYTDDFFSITLSDVNGTDSWQAVDRQKAPDTRARHTATLLKNGKIYVIGGISSNGFASMSQINVYDLNLNTWSVQSSRGSVPGQRQYHRAVAISDTNILIWGGTTDYKYYFNDLYILDTSASPYNWILQPTLGKLPAGRAAHSMVMAGTNLVINFADGVPNTLILDTTSFTWTSEYTPIRLELTSTSSIAPSNNTSYDNPGVSNGPLPSTNPKKNTTDSNAYQSSSAKNIGVIVGSTAGSSILLFSSIAIFLLYRQRKKRFGRSDHEVEGRVRESSFISVRDKKRPSIYLESDTNNQVVI